MQTHTIRQPVAAIIAIGVALLLVAGAVAVFAREGTMNPGPKPTVVLVHGAFADASTWTTVIDQLQKGSSGIAVGPFTELVGRVAADTGRQG